LLDYTLLYYLINRETTGIRFVAARICFSTGDESCLAPHQGSVQDVLRSFRHCR